eukprot:UN21398
MCAAEFPIDPPLIHCYQCGHNRCYNRSKTTVLGGGYTVKISDFTFWFTFTILSC